jgi:hypothetical protein
MKIRESNVCLDNDRQVGHLTRLNPQDAWLPITESRSGNAHYAGFHSLNAGLGFQALLLPVAFSFLGWFVLFILSSLFAFLYFSSFSYVHTITTLNHDLLGFVCNNT